MTMLLPARLSEVPPTIEVMRYLVDESFAAELFDDYAVPLPSITADESAEIDFDLDNPQVFEPEDVQWGFHVTDRP